MVFDDCLIVSELPSGNAPEVGPFSVGLYMDGMIGPCIGCPQWQRCADDRLACRSFRAFVTYGRTLPPSEPSEHWYRRIYSEEDK